MASAAKFSILIVIFALLFEHFKSCQLFLHKKETCKLVFIDFIGAFA